MENKSFSERLRIFSLLYLISVWLFAFAGLLNTSNIFRLTDILYLPYLLMIIPVFVITWQWTRNLYSYAENLHGKYLGIKKGWSFWGWITPIACFWIPKKLINKSQEVLIEKANLKVKLTTESWWNIYLITLILDSISARFSFAPTSQTNTNLLVLFDIASAITLSIAYPKWMKVIDETDNLILSCENQKD
jgi:amino acid permease